MNKKNVVIACIVLLIWFFLDMVGVYFNNTYLVTQSYKDDGLFFAIYLISLLLFIFKEKIGKYILTIWLSMWLFFQYLFHYGYQLIGQTTESKINYFNGSIKLININNGYFPDLYHFILHILILTSIVILIVYIIKSKKRINN